MNTENGTAFVERRLPLPDGFILAYRDYQPAGPTIATVLLVHGLASFGRQFEADAACFAQAGYRVLLPDLRGHGASVTPPGFRPEQFSIPSMAQDLVALLDAEAADTVHWVGNSLGGILALGLLGGPAQDRLASLTLFGTCLSMNLPSFTPLALRSAFLPGKRTTGWLTARSTTANPHGQRLIAQAIEQFDVSAGAAIAAHVGRYDFVDAVRRLARPPLVLWGGKDRAVNLQLGPDLARLGAAHYRRIDLPQGGHCSNLDLPDRFRAALLEHWRLSPAGQGASASW